ncbi:unnamed protein product [Lactuca virosa]|uniref:Uncharacterized protein n=1 Tax=Lactuca virosa TaxID=75947 RepID=A0AAU9PC51_9ASTR|nr:unnamed protein product [Lactuca virosa]
MHSNAQVGILCWGIGCMLQLCPYNKRRIFDCWCCCMTYGSWISYWERVYSQFDQLHYGFSSNFKVIKSTAPEIHGNSLNLMLCYYFHSYAHPFDVVTQKRIEGGGGGGGGGVVVIGGGGGGVW